MSRCHVAIRVEAYKDQTGLTQCYNRQQFGMSGLTASDARIVSGVGAVGKKIPTCCNCKLVDGEEPHPSNYRGCRHAKEEARKRKSQTAPNTTTERMFSFSHTTPGLLSVAVLRNNTQEPQQPQPPSAAQACPDPLSGRDGCPHSLEAQPTSTKSVSSGSECKQFVSGRQVHSSRSDITADHDTAQWERRVPPLT
jgi:hypothetical protein